MTRHAMFDGFRWTPARQRPAGPENYRDSATQLPLRKRWGLSALSP